MLWSLPTPPLLSHAPSTQRNIPPPALPWSLPSQGQQVWSCPSVPSAAPAPPGLDPGNACPPSPPPHSSPRLSPVLLGPDQARGLGSSVGSSHGHSRAPGMTLGQSWSPHHLEHPPWPGAETPGSWTHSAPTHVGQGQGHAVRTPCLGHRAAGGQNTDGQRTCRHHTLEGHAHTVQS